MNKVIGICNQKGGVGKTTTSINLASCLAVAEKKTLLIDMDAQCNATTGMGMNKDDVEISIYDILISERKKRGGINIKDAVVKSNQIDFLDIIPSKIDLAGAEIELVNEMAREKKLCDAVNELKDEYEYIIIDSPPSLGLLTVNVLAAADSVLIPIQCEYYALEGLAELLNTIRLIQKRINRTLVIEGVLLTMYDSRLNLSKQVAEDVRSYFTGKVFNTIIPRNVKLSEAPSYGKPIILYDIVSAGAESFLNLAKEIMNNE